MDAHTRLAAGSTRRSFPACDESLPLPVCRHKHAHRPDTRTFASFPPDFDPYPSPHPLCTPPHYIPPQRPACFTPPFVSTSQPLCPHTTYPSPLPPPFTIKPQDCRFEIPLMQIRTRVTSVERSRPHAHPTHKNITRSPHPGHRPIPPPVASCFALRFRFPSFAPFPILLLNARLLPSVAHADARARRGARAALCRSPPSSPSVSHPPAHLPLSGSSASACTHRRS